MTGTDNFYEPGNTETQDTQEKVWRIPVTGEERPHLTIEGIDEALRVVGEEGATALSLRATTRRGDTLPLDLVAEVQLRKDGALRIKLRSTNEIRREINRRIREADPRHGDAFGNIGERLEALTLLKGLQGKVDQLQIVAIVPPRCDVTLSTVNGPIQVGRLNGRVQVQTTNAPLDCARIEGTLSARTINGSLRLGDITGNVSAQTTSGSIATRNITGNLVIQTTSGTAKGENLNGQLGFKSMSGGLVVRESHFSGFYFNNTSGSCSIEAILDAGEYEMRTVSGAITLRPQANLNAILSGRTVSGSFRCQIPHRYANEDWQGEGAADDARADSDLDDDGPDIALPGLTIGKRGIDIGGMLHIDDETVELPGMRIKIKGKRERRRGRNRWEYLLGDPALATSGQTRLRIRTVSGSLQIGAGAVAEAQPLATPTRATPAPAPIRREWPDAELWPDEVGEIAVSPPPPPTPLTPPTPPTPPALPRTPETAPPTRADAVSTDAIPVNDEIGTAEAARADGPATIGAAPASDVTPADAAPPLVAASTTAPVAGGDNLRLNILEALRRGEITTDEALLLLAQLDD